MWKRPIPFEQAVYGSFPFWSRGYAILAHSANCQPAWLSALKQACQRFGERPLDSHEASGIFAIPLPDGVCMIVGVFPNGCDDQGRPGALVFHARFIAPRPYRKSGYNPFAFVEGLCGDWTIDDIDATLPTGWISARHVLSEAASRGERASEIARLLVHGKQVVVPSGSPIDDLTREVWAELPTRVRRRISMATFAYDNGNRFDLVALPARRVAGLALARDPGCVILAPESSAEPGSASVGIRATDERLPASNLRRPHLLGRLFRTIIPLVISAGLMGCSGGKDVTPEAVADARSIWEKSGIKDYELELKIASPTGHYRSTVRDGKVLKVESIQPDGRVLDAHPGDPRFYSVDGQFSNMVEELAIRDSAEPFGQPKGTKVVMRFDPDSKLGYPRWYRRDVLGANRGVAIDVLRMEPQPPKP